MDLAHGSAVAAALRYRAADRRFGRLGQDVRAAGSGRVVYTGNGLRGYGNLVIIKHGDSLLTSYAHNRELLVHEGQEVAMGEVIAHMGPWATPGVRPVFRGPRQRQAG